MDRRHFLIRAGVLGAVILVNPAEALRVRLPHRWVYGPKHSGWHQALDSDLYGANLFAVRDDGVAFYTSSGMTGEEYSPQNCRTVEIGMRLSLDQYLDPDCSCRVGHVCRLHG